MIIASGTQFQFYLLCLKWESGSSRFQPGEGSSRGLLRDWTTGCGTDGSFYSSSPDSYLWVQHYNQQWKWGGELVVCSQDTFCHLLSCDRKGLLFIPTGEMFSALAKKKLFLRVRHWVRLYLQQQLSCYAVHRVQRPGGQMTKAGCGFYLHYCDIRWMQG